MSSHRSGPVRSMTRVKLTTSLAAVSPATTASVAILAPAERARCGRSEHGTERVRAPVAEHRALAKVLGQQHGGSRQRRRRRWAGGAGTSQQPAGGASHLDRAAGPQVEQVQQVGTACDQPGVDEDVERRRMPPNEPCAGLRRQLLRPR